MIVGLVLFLQLQMDISLQHVQVYDQPLFSIHDYIKQQKRKAAVIIAHLMQIFLDFLKGNCLMSSMHLKQNKMLLPNSFNIIYKTKLFILKLERLVLVYKVYN